MLLGGDPVLTGDILTEAKKLAQRVAELREFANGLFGRAVLPGACGSLYGAGRRGWGVMSHCEVIYYIAPRRIVSVNFLDSEHRVCTFRKDQRIYNAAMPLESVRKIADADFPTRWGRFRILGFEGTVVGPEPCREGATVPSLKTEGAVALVMGNVSSGVPIVRIHSQCLTGDVFHSLRCDCRQQLELALEKISDAGSGILLYEQQEGRGIGLMAKLKAYELQDQGRDTVEANVELGFKADCREFELPAAILKLMGVSSVRLITNNPEKVAALEAAGVSVTERIAADVEAEDTFRHYLKVKREKMGHFSDSSAAE